MPVRIYDISKKLGLENKDVLAKAKELGITAARVPSSSLDKITAEFLEHELTGGRPPAPLVPPPPPEPEKIVLVTAPEPEPVIEVKAPVIEPVVVIPENAPAPAPVHEAPAENGEPVIALTEPPTPVAPVAPPHPLHRQPRLARKWVIRWVLFNCLPKLRRAALKNRGPDKSNFLHPAPVFLLVDVLISRVIGTTDAVEIFAAVIRVAKTAIKHREAEAIRRFGPIPGSPRPLSANPKPANS